MAQKMASFSSTAAQGGRQQRASKDLLCERAREYGLLLVFQKLRHDLGLEEFLTRYVAEWQYEFPVVDAVFAMLLNWLLEPHSKLGVSHWIENVEEPASRELSPPLLPGHGASLREQGPAGGRSFPKELGLVLPGSGPGVLRHDHGEFPGGGAGGVS